jgi:hypothetical protein
VNVFVTLPMMNLVSGSMGTVRKESVNPLAAR